MKTWFTSDHHFGHANIIKYCNRPFYGTHDMNVAMEVAWNEVIEPNDLVYYLGDFAINANLVPFLVSRLNGIKILIPGNHDKCWQKTDPSNRWFAHYIDAGFQSIQQQMILNVSILFALATGKDINLGLETMLNEFGMQFEGPPSVPQSKRARSEIF